jgi:hypothetical protein
MRTLLLAAVALATPNTRGIIMLALAAALTRLTAQALRKAAS